VTVKIEKISTHISERVPRVPEREDFRRELERVIKESDSDESHWIRLNFNIPEMDPLLWLSYQKGSDRFYWRDRDGRLEIAGMGSALRIEAASLEEIFPRINELFKIVQKAPDGLRFFGGIRFNATAEMDADWQPFGIFRSIAPAVEVCREPDRCRLSINYFWQKGTSRSEVREQLFHIFDGIIFRDAQPIPVNGEYLKILKRIDVPDFSGWRKNIEQALSIITSRELEKIVLARKSSFVLNDHIDPLALMYRLRKRAHPAFHFMFQVNGEHYFLGATPERLYYRTDRHIFSEAVAGTRQRGETPEDDRKLEAELVNSEKDVWEHRLVVNSIRQVFKKICQTYMTDPALQVVKLSKVQHLYLGFRGQLKNRVSDADIIRLLHPTPAVGGYPTNRALEWIDHLEGFDRGWYAGPVGWIGKDKAEFVVAIRSGMVVRNQLHLFSGAGIVEGSEARAEWMEIENKIENFLKIFQ